ncbi:hypothetical protein Ga0061079_10975 [Apibacter mensalis]|uniref:Uncharacterized protein n=1 Tax=Apibacter mensalis TaxID=1586267 RepID=A0A0X3ARJ6_9FLAO|nr:hypothetical protein [Apibacter mensalis]CVK16685.1 hypothetical protein Ga0061079_10975 [Apibacter mensalis]
MIQKEFIENIIEIFRQNDKFEYVDFKIDINQNTIKIIYLIEPKYFILCKDENYFIEKIDNEKYNISGEVVPGRFSMHENFVLDKINDVYIRIEKWLDVIWNEISLTSPLSLLAEEQEQIDKICEKFDEYDDYFNTEEIIIIKQKLKLLRKNLEEEIISIVDDYELSRLEIEKMHKNFDTLEQILPSLKKKGWVRSLTGRVFHNTKRLLELRQKLILNTFNQHKEE